MSNRKLIGRVSATEKYPSSCDDFQFWLSDDTILSPFDIVRVENKTDDSITYGVVQDILHIPLLHPICSKKILALPLKQKMLCQKFKIISTKTN